MQARLLALVLATVFSIGAATAWLGYRRAVHEVDELFDAQLTQYARIMLALSYSGNDEAITFPEIFEHRYQSRILFQIWEREHGQPRLILTSPGATREWPAGVAADGFSVARIGDRSWRCFAAHDPKGQHALWTCLDLRTRDELSRDIALDHLKPYAFALPLLTLLLMAAIRRGLRPLHRIDAELNERSPERLDPLSDEQAPGELRPVIQTMNGLFARMRQTLDHERRFTSDAAHELRTPLAALLVQLQVAQRAHDGDERQASIAKAIKGAARLSHLVHQLLALARLDAVAETPGGSDFDLSALAEDAIQEIMPAASEKQCRLLSAIEPELTVNGIPQLMAVLIRNLLDNAVRYGAVGGRVEVRLHAEMDSIVLQVADDGPGVAQADRAKLGARFQRFSPQALEGVGLGISIVQRIADLHRGKLAFGDGLDGRGLCVSLRLAASGARP